MKALVPQGLTGSPNYFGLLNNFMTLIICESLREIGEMACVTHVWSSRGQTLKLPLQKIDQVIRKNNGETSLTRKDYVFFLLSLFTFQGDGVYIGLIEGSLPRKQSCNQTLQR